jgi:transcriptional regulator with XRE-family HTH domain
MDEEALKKLVGNKIKELRSIKHWSRPQVSGKLKMSENNYGCIERGEIDVSLIRLAQLAKIFGSYMNIYGISIPELVDSNTNEKNVYNLTGKGRNNENFHNWTIGCSETETLILKHELEKAQLIQQSLEKENELLRKQVSQLEQINQLLKGEK